MTDQAEILSEQVKAYGRDQTRRSRLHPYPGGRSEQNSYGLPTPITPISSLSGPPPRPAIASLVRWVDGLSVDAAVPIVVVVP